MQLISADATIFSKQCYVSFLPQKVEKKTPSKVAQKNSNPPLFSLLPELPKRPKQKNSCSKMWLIDQLYIELGLGLCSKCTLFAYEINKSLSAVS